MRKPMLSIYNQRSKGKVSAHFRLSVYIHVYTFRIAIHHKDIWPYSIRVKLLIPKARWFTSIACILKL